MHFTVPISQRLSKLIRSLHKKQMRDQNGLFLVEGEKLCSELLNSSFDIELVVIREHPSMEAIDLAEKFSQKGIAIYSANRQHFDLLTDTKSPQSILAISFMKEIEPNFTKPFIALDNLADPGNVGTIIRTADWFGIHNIILGSETADKFNPKTVRATMGSIFRCSIVSDFILAEYIRDNYKDFEIYGATLSAKTYMEKIVPPKKKYGIVFGNESTGISEPVQKLLTRQYKIKGAGSSESLNVAVSVGISLYYFTNQK